MCPNVPTERHSRSGEQPENIRERLMKLIGLLSRDVARQIKATKQQQTNSSKND